MIKRLLTLQSIYASMVATLLGASASRATPTQVNVARTNLVDRWITNLVEVRMPVNRFVDVYHTNWVEQFRTNVVNHYATNIVTRMQTNQVWVDVPRTNYLVAYRTNWTTINLTNWSTVLVFKTNWVSQPVTNTVQIDLPGPVNATGHAAVERAALKQPVQPAPAPRPVSPLAMDARRGGRRLPPNQVEVLLSVRWNSDPEMPLLVQQWRIESDDGSILCFGQDRQFTRTLPLGKYKVQVRAQRDRNSPILAALGTLAVSPGEVTLQPNTAGKM